MSVKMKFGSKDIPFVYKGNKLVYPNPIKDGLLLWYDFKGMRNTDMNKEVAKDLSLNGNDGTLTNFNFTEGSGYKDNTLVFDGVDDKMVIPELELDETAMTVVQDGKVYSYEDDKVLAIKDYSDKELTYLESLRDEGRNLIRGSEFKEQTSYYTYQNIDAELSGGILIATNKITTSYPRIIYRPLENLIVGEKYTISFKAKADSEFSASFWVSDVNGASSQMTAEMIPYTKKWEVYSYIFTVNERLSDSTAIQWWVNKTNPDTVQTLYLKEVQLEKGITATDWSPAPEDVRENLPGLEAGGRNLVLDSGIRNGHILNASGTVGSSNTHKVTDFIPIKANAEYIFSAEQNPEIERTYENMRIGFYDSERNFLNLIYIVAPEKKGEVFTTPENAHFTRISVGNYPINLMLMKGSVPMDWSPAPEDFQTTSLSPSSISNLQLYNRPLRKDELLHNVESGGLKELVDGVIVQDGLMLHYDFSHESNTSEYKGKAFDYSGNGNHGELQNFNFTEESGYVGNKLKFDGVDDRVLMISPGAESKDFLSSEMTIVWSGNIRDTQDKSGINQILSAGYVNGWALGYHAQIDKLMYTVRDSNDSHGSGYSIRYLDRPPFGEFFTFAMTFKKGEVTAYLNGTEKNKSIVAGDIIYSTYPAVEITRQAHQTTASCKIYNRTLTPEEIAHNYAIEKEKFDIVEGEI